MCVFLQDECYQVRQIFAQKLHLALVRLLLPLQYLAVFSLCAKDPVKERRAHARQCLLKNITVRREYLKQNPLAHGQSRPRTHPYSSRPHPLRRAPTLAGHASLDTPLL